MTLGYILDQHDGTTRPSGAITTAVDCCGHCLSHFLVWYSQLASHSSIPRWMQSAC